MLSTKITVILASKNEENRIELAIRNYLGLFPIVASDNYSSDRTQSIYGSYGIRFHLHTGPRQESRELVEHFYSLANTPYILMGFAGEFIPLPLLKKFAEIANSDSYDIVLNSRRNITHGVSYYPWWKEVSNTMRFFKKGSIDLDKLRIHQFFKPVVPESRILRIGVGQPEYCVYQFRDYDAQRTMQVNIDYGITEANQRFLDGTSYSLLDVFKRILISIFYFVFRGGWLRGRLGFRELWSGAVLISIIYWRGSDLRNNMTLQDCAKANRELRQELFKKYGGLT